MASPTEAEWEKIGERVAQDLPSYSTKDSARYFGKEAKNDIHNDIRNSLQRKGKKGDLNKYAIVKHYKQLLPGIRNKLIDEGKVILYTYNGEVKYRNAESKWSPEEEATLKTSYNSQSDKQIAKALGRSKSSVRKHRISLGLKKVVK